jgi:flagellar hook-associated protein 1 FlgK
MRDLAGQLDQLRIGTLGQLKTDATAINSLANQIAKANQEIARAVGTGQSPNDLLDQRDQLVRDLNRYVQTTNIPANDGTMGIFLAGSQPLVLGTTVSPVAIVNDDFNNPSKARLTINIAGTATPLDEAMLGGGEVSGLLRFQNTDLVEAGNLLGRMALAIGTRMNEQQRLGLDLNGNQGTNLFNLAALPGGFPAGPGGADRWAEHHAWWRCRSGGRPLRAQAFQQCGQQYQHRVLLARRTGYGQPCGGCGGGGQ